MIETVPEEGRNLNSPSVEWKRNEQTTHFRELVEEKVHLYAIVKMQSMCTAASPAVLYSCALAL